MKFRYKGPGWEVKSVTIFMNGGITLSCRSKWYLSIEIYILLLIYMDIVENLIVLICFLVLMYSQLFAMLWNFAISRTINIQSISDRNSKSYTLKVML